MLHVLKQIFDQHQQVKTFVSILTNKVVLLFTYFCSLVPIILFHHPMKKWRIIVRFLV